MTWPSAAPPTPAPPVQSTSYQPPAPDPYQPPASQAPYQPPVAPGLQPPKPDNNLVLSIICLVLCCLPLGIVALIKSTQVDTLYAQGRYAEAQESANAAKKWALVGFGAALAMIVLYGLLVVAGIGASLLNAR